MFVKIKINNHGKNAYAFFSYGVYKMNLLFKKKYYPANASFWTAIEYRLAYGDSVLDIIVNDTAAYIENMVKLLHVSIDGEKHLYNELLEEALNPNGDIIFFCSLLYEKIMKSDKFLEKYIKNKPEQETKDSEEQFDEFFILELFKRTPYPERLLYTASFPQIIGLIIKYSESISGGAGTVYKEMSTKDIKAFYGVS